MSLLHCFVCAWISIASSLAEVTLLGSLPLAHQASPHWRTFVSTLRSTTARSGRTARGALAAAPLAACSSVTCVASTARRPPSSRVTWAPTPTTRPPRTPSPLMWLPAAQSPLATWWQHPPSTSPVTRWWTCSSQTALALQHRNPKVSSRELISNNPCPSAEGKVRDGWSYS